MNAPRSYLTSQVFRRLILGAIILCILFVSICYGLLQYQYRQSVKDHFSSDVNVIAKAITKSIDENGLVTQAVVDRYALLGSNYRMMLFTPHGGSYINENNPSDYSFRLPAFNADRRDTVTLENNVVDIWKNLPNGYQLFAQIQVENPQFWQNTQHTFWLSLLSIPLLIALLAILGISIIYRRLYNAWIKVFEYTKTIESTTFYNPLKVESSKELGSFETIINRLAFRFIKQKHSIEQLTKNQKELIHSTPELLFRLDKQLKITFANHNFAHTFSLNISRQGTRTEIVDNILITKLVDAVTAEHKKQLASLVDEPKQLRILVKDQSGKNTYDLWINPIYHNSNELNIFVGYTGSLHNVTRDQVKLNQLALKQLEIDERLQSNEQLWAVMGHELRTPLNGMIGMIQLLNETNLNEEQADFLSTLKSSSDNMLFLLNDMLDLSKIDAGKMQAVISEIDILALSREVCDLMAGNAAKKSLELVFFAEPETPRFVPGDPFRIRQVLLNLMGNALKFTKTGHVAILVEQVDKHHDAIASRFLNNTSKQWLRFRINDTGPGIPEHEQQQLFMFFNQANSSISRRFGGTGLGLAISKGLAEMMGGFITLESTAGVGTTFSLFLPFEIENDRPMYVYPQLSDNLCLLIFDPNPLNQNYLGSLLESIGIEAHFFSELSKDNLSVMSSQTSAHLTPILLVDYELLADHDDLNTILTLPEFTGPDKLLLSHRNQRSIPSRIFGKFNGFIAKPIFIENFLGEILRVSEATVAKIQPVDKKDIDSMIDEIKEAQETQSHEQKQTQPDTVAMESEKIHVLLAEDNKINQKVATKMLEKQGYRVTKAENGEECIEKLKALDDVKLIFMDCRMPKMDGLTATKLIREQNISTPIIALTANDTEEDREACEQAGMDDFLAKPINQEKLTKLLQRYKPLLK